MGKSVQIGGYKDDVRLGISDNTVFQSRCDDAVHWEAAKMVYNSVD